MYSFLHVCASSTFMSLELCTIQLGIQSVSAFIFYFFSTQILPWPYGSCYNYSIASHLAMLYSERKGKKCVLCTENRSPTGLVSFNMQNTEFVLREMERCVSFVFVLGGWRVWMQFTRSLCSHSPIFCVICFFPVLHLSTLSSLSILLQHNGAGVVKLLQPGKQI